MKLEDAVLEVLRGRPEKSFSYGDPELQRLLPDVDRQTIDFALHNLSTKGLIWKGTTLAPCQSPRRKRIDARLADERLSRLMPAA
ncbi:MAG TPA: hypothetical protein VFY10_02335 [Dehalococcoidia bacterium]|nr:hypothetical protein [Dehalococcoidia bacterium]